MPFYYFIIIFQIEIYIRHKIYIFSLIMISWIHPIKFIPVYLKYTVIKSLISRLQFSFYFILLYCAFLLSFLFFRGGNFSLIFFIYQPPPIECNNDRFFLRTRWFRKFNWDFLKQFFIVPKYIL